jgi:hypothetical protein
MAEEQSSIPVIPARPVRKSLDSDAPPETPPIPARPTKRPAVVEPEALSAPPSIPKRPTGFASTDSAALSPKELTEDYMIDGIEKIVPLLPAATDIDETGEDLTPSLHDVVHPPTPPSIPQRPTRKTSMDSQRSIQDVDVLPIPRRPMRKPSSESAEGSQLHRQVSQKSSASIGDDAPIIPARPGRRSSGASQSGVDIEAEPPKRQPSIKIIPETTDDSQEPIIPPRPRRASVKSTNEESVPFIPPRPRRKSSVKSVQSHHSIEEEEPQPLSRKSTLSVETPSAVKEETGPSVSTGPPPLPSRDASVHLNESDRHPEEEEEIAQAEEDIPAVEEIPSSPHQHSAILVEEAKQAEVPASVPSPVQATTASKIPEIPVVPARPMKKTAGNEPIHPKPSEEVEPVAAEIPAIPVRPTKKSSPEASQDIEVPVIPARPKQAEPASEAVEIKEEEQESPPSIPSRLFKKESVPPGMSIPIIPARPTRPKSREPSEQQAPIPIEAKSPSSEPQAELVSKPSPPAKPPIPARPQHRLAKTFEPPPPPVKGKPVPPPRPTKTGASSRFDALRAQFAKDLNDRLAKPAPVLPHRKKEEEEVAMAEPAKTEAKEVEKEEKAETVGDMRKGRARGPQRRPPTVKPIVPAGWGISTIATVYEQPGDEPLPEKSTETISQEKAQEENIEEEAKEEPLKIEEAPRTEVEVSPPLEENGEVPSTHSIIKESEMVAKSPKELGKAFIPPAEVGEKLKQIHGVSSPEEEKVHEEQKAGAVNDVEL